MWNVYRKFTKSMLRLKRTGDKSARMFCHLTTYSIFGLNTSCTDSFQLKSLPVVPGRLLMWKFYRKDCWSQTSFNRSSIKTQERRRAETFGEDYFYFSVRLLSSIRHISANDRRGAQNIDQCIGQSQRGYTHTHTHAFTASVQPNRMWCHTGFNTTSDGKKKSVSTQRERRFHIVRRLDAMFVVFCQWILVCLFQETHTDPPVNRHISMTTHSSRPPPVWHQRSINAERQFDEPKKKEIRQTKQKILTCRTLNEAPRRPPSFKVHFQTEMLYKLTIQC